MKKPETPSDKVLREHRQERIVDYSNKGDGRNMDAELDVWPYGEIRRDISEEQAHHIATQGLKSAMAKFKETS